MKKIYPTEEHTDIEYGGGDVCRELTELEKAHGEIKILNMRIKKMQDEVAYYENIRREQYNEMTTLRTELNAIKWTVETIFGRTGNG